MNQELKHKIVKLPALLKALKPLRGKKTIAFTNGCFDLLHFGHVNYLQTAKAKDRILVVGINSDASVRRLKGPTRPIVPELARATVMAALQSVDYVVIFEDDTPQKLIEAVKPDVLIKGADWKGKRIAGDDAVKAHGGKIQFIKFEDGFSTTGILEKIKKL